MSAILLPISVKCMIMGFRSARERKPLQEIGPIVSELLNAA